MKFILYSLTLKCKLTFLKNGWRTKSNLMFVIGGHVLDDSMTTTHDFHFTFDWATFDEQSVSTHQGDHSNCLIIYLMFPVNYVFSLKWSCIDIFFCVVWFFSHTNRLLGHQNRSFSFKTLPQNFNVCVHTGKLFFSPFILMPSFECDICLCNLIS